MMRHIFVLGLAILLASCGAKVDTSDPQAYTKSIANMTKDLPAEKKAEFRDALIAIAFNQADPTKGLWSSADPAAPIFIGAAAKIDGKTVDEIIKLGYETRVSVIDAEMTKLSGEIQRQQDARTKHKAIFDNIHIDVAKYHLESNGFMTEPVISFKITNNSKLALKTIYLDGVLTSPGRQIPWVKAGLNYKFDGGLEPGESKSMDLTPNMFGDWKAADYSRRDDLNLALTLINVEGADGQPLVEGDPEDVEKKTAEAAALQKTRSEMTQKLSTL